MAAFVIIIYPEFMPYLACVMQFPLIARGCSGDEHAWILKVCHYCNRPCQIKIIWSVLWPWKCYLSWTQVVWLMHTSKQISQCMHSDWLNLNNFLHSCKHVSDLKFLNVILLAVGGKHVLNGVYLSWMCVLWVCNETDFILCSIYSWLTLQFSSPFRDLII